MQHVGRDEPHQQCQRRHHFEVDECFCAHAPYFAHVSHARNADDDRGEDDWRERHADQLDEAVAQWLQRDGGMREQYANRDAEHDSYHHLQPQRAEQRPAPGRAALIDRCPSDHVYSASCRITLIKSDLPSKPMPGNSGMVT